MWRRDFLKTAPAAAGAAFTTNLFTGSIRGANNRVTVGFIGLGRMGRSNLSHALKTPGVEVTRLCDVYRPNLELGARQAKVKAKTSAGFEDILADKSVDAVCISTPDHWHAFLTVEACKAGKDVYVEKPISVTVDEGKTMVEAARKYNRVVQAGTMQRSAEHFQKAIELVRGGVLGKVTAARTWNYAHERKEGIGNPADSDPPPGLDWDGWLGPAPKRRYNANRFGYDIEHLENPRWFSHFRWFWDYAGGMMTDWGVHLLDIVQAALNEEQPKTVTATGGKFYLTDNRETPDTLQVNYEYPSGLIATYENRNNNSQSLFDKPYGILLFGENGTMFIDRTEYYVLPEPKASAPAPASGMKAVSQGNARHWQNFVDCMHSRQRPVSDIEICYKSTTTCLLGNVAYRSGERIDFDVKNPTVTGERLNKWLGREYRAPFRLSL